MDVDVAGLGGGIVRFWIRVILGMKMGVVWCCDDGWRERCVGLCWC